MNIDKNQPNPRPFDLQFSYKKPVIFHSLYFQNGRLWGECSTRCKPPLSAPAIESLLQSGLAH